MREGFLRLDKKEGQIVNAFGEVLFVRRKRDGAEVYKAPSTETEICSHVAPKEVWVVRRVGRAPVQVLGGVFL